MDFFWSADRSCVYQGEMTEGDRPATTQEVSAWQARLTDLWLKGTAKRIRDERKPVLDALTGIAGRAMRAGNDALAAECDALSQQLLDVTKQPAVLAAIATGNDKAVSASVLTLYRAYAATASPAVQSAFQEFS